VKAGVDYPDTERLRAARIAVTVAAVREDPDIEAYRVEHRAAFAEARAASANVHPETEADRG
jgi:hypothetical protein